MLLLWACLLLDMEILNVNTESIKETRMNMYKLPM